MWKELIGAVLSLLLGGCALGVTIDRIPQAGGETGFRAVRSIPESPGWRERGRLTRVRG